MLRTAEGWINMLGLVKFASSLRQRMARTHAGRSTAAQSASPIPAVESLERRLQMSVVSLAAGNLTDVGSPDGPAVEATPLLPDITPLTNKQKGYVYHWRLDRTEKPGRTLLRLTSSMANLGAGPLELRGGAVVDGKQQVHQRIFDDQGNFTDRLAGHFTHHAAHHHTHFDDFAQYNLRNVTATGGVGRAVRSGKKVSFCLTDSEPHDSTLPNSPPDGEYYSCNSRRQGISVGWADIYSSSLPDQWVDVTNVRPGKYWLEVVVDPSDSIQESDETNNTTRILITLKDTPKPRNDDFAQGLPLVGTLVTSRVSNQNASRQTGEPIHGSTKGGASLWWKWTAPRSAPVTITTAGSDIDTILAVYKGTSLTNLQKVTSNDDDPKGSENTSRVTFTAQKGVTYHIAVDGYQAEQGQVKLTLRRGVL
jgi:hypothetical protein